VNLPSGKNIVIFVFNSKISHEVSFGNILNNGKELANLVISEFKDDDDIILVAADGETYGHHKKFGELGLAYALYTLSSNPAVKICNLEYYLEKVGVYYEAEINENTSWSCYHGIERWKDDCGCKFNPNTSQKWRKNLRLVIDTIRNTFEQVYVDNLSLLDTVDVRKEYINYLLKRDNEINELQDLKDFICYFSENNSLKDCQKAEKLITLLEIYKNIVFAYTSCGWFFDDISGLEATTNLKFLYYAVKKLKELCKIDLEPVIKTILKDTPSNYYPDALHIYDKFVKSCYLSTEKIISSYVLNKIFLKDKTKFLNHFWKIENYEKYSQEKIIISVGNIQGTDICTLLNFKKDYVFLYLENFNFYIGLGDFNTHELFSNLKEYLVKKDISKMIELVNKHCKDKFSLKDIFV
ncbi:MAG: DUF3536 domain-containing protein, partial [bacterium]